MVDPMILIEGIIEIFFENPWIGSYDTWVAYGDGG